MSKKMRNENGKDWALLQSLYDDHVPEDEDEYRI